MAPINAEFLMMIFIGIFMQKLTKGVITDVRLVNGTSPYVGTIEIMEDNGIWKTTCGTSNDFTDIVVICKHLGSPGANRIITNTPFGPSPVPTTFLNCPSGSNMLSSCSVSHSTACSSSAGAAACYDNSYLGCFVDNANDRVLDADTQLISITMTIDFCKNYCRSLMTDDYTYAGVENGNECYCGTAETQYARHGIGNNADCHRACAGNHIDSCGGPGFIAVFIISIPVTTEPAVFTTSQSTVPSASDSNSRDSMTSSQADDISTSMTSMTSMTTTGSRLTAAIHCDHTGLYTTIGVETFIILVFVVAAFVGYLLKRRPDNQLEGGVKSLEKKSTHPSSSTGGQEDGNYLELSKTLGSQDKANAGFYQELSGTGIESQQAQKPSNDDDVYYSNQIHASKESMYDLKGVCDYENVKETK